MTIKVFDVFVQQVLGQAVVNAYEGQSVVRSKLLDDEISTIQELAEWVIAQETEIDQVDLSLQKRLTIDFHTETDGQLEWIVIDLVTAVPLPVDQGKAGFGSLPGWADWTAQEASDWIDTNVVDLASAKVALSNMARAIVYLRNVSID